MSTLKQLDAALERGDHGSALGHALAAWANCRAASTAAIIEQLSAKVASTRARPGGTTIDDKQKAWLGLASKNDPSDLELLLATLADIKKAAPLEARLEALRGRSDPRIATAMHALLLHPPVPGRTGIRIIDLMLELIVGTADPRSDPAFAELATHIKAGSGMATWALGHRLKPAHDRLRERLALVSDEPNAADRKILARIETRLAAQAPKRAARDADELFAAVYANPADEQARAVLADLLLERGDPRGELISLQLARGARGKRTKREAELLARHGREWLGRLEPVVLKTGLVYEGGFLSKCGVRFEHRDAGELVGAPEWRTVTELHIGERRLVGLIDGMPSLRGLVVKSASSLTPHPTVERVTIDELDDDVAALRDDGLPALRELEIGDCFFDVDAKSALHPELLSRLERFEIRVKREIAASDWTAVVAAHPIPHASVQFFPWRLSFVGENVEIERTTRNVLPTDELDALAQMLERVPKPKRRHVVFRSKLDTKIRSGSALATALKRFSDYQLAN